MWCLESGIKMRSGCITYTQKPESERFTSYAQIEQRRNQLCTTGLPRIL